MSDDNKNETGRIATALLKAEHGAGDGPGFNTRQRMAIAKVLADELTAMREAARPKPAAVIKPKRKAKTKTEEAAGDGD